MPCCKLYVSLVASILVGAIASCTSGYNATVHFIQEIVAITVSRQGDRLVFAYVNNRQGEGILYSCATDGSDIRQLNTFARPEAEIAKGTPFLKIEVDKLVCEGLTQDSIQGPGWTDDGVFLNWASDSTIFGVHGRHFFSMSSDGISKWAISPTQLSDACTIPAQQPHRPPLFARFSISPSGSTVALPDGLLFERSGRFSDYLKRTFQPQPAYLRSPAWSPSGDELSFISYESGQSSLVLHSLRQSEFTDLQVEGGWKPCPASALGWNAARNLLACYMERDLGQQGQDCHLVLFAPSGKVVKSIKIDVAPLDFAFSPDGKTLYIVEAGYLVQNLYSLDIETEQLRKLVDANQLPQQESVYSI